MVDVYGAELLGSRFCQSLFTRPDFSAMASMSPDSASVTTSASRPSITERACLPEPPCDWLTSSVCPVFCFHCAPNALLTSWYSSRVGSYDTFSSFTCACATPAPSTSAAAAAITVNFSLVMFVLPSVRVVRDVKSSPARGR